MDIRQGGRSNVVASHFCIATWLMITKLRNTVLVNTYMGREETTPVWING